MAGASHMVPSSLETSQPDPNPTQNAPNPTSGINGGMCMFSLSL